MYARDCRGAGGGHWTESEQTPKPYEVLGSVHSEGSGWSGSGTPKSPVVGDPHIKIINIFCKRMSR